MWNLQLRVFATDILIDTAPEIYSVLVGNLFLLSCKKVWSRKCLDSVTANSTLLRSQWNSARLHDLSHPWLPSPF